MPLTTYHHCNEKIVDVAINHRTLVVGIYLSREQACPVRNLQIHDVILWI